MDSGFRRNDKVGIFGLFASSSTFYQTGFLIMPIYEFECSACRHVYERVMKVGEAYENLTCPECGVQQPKKLIGSCSFHSRERYEERLARRMAARAQEK